MKSLDDLQLLDRVKFISTASGGTITAIKYAIDRTNNESFDSYYSSMYDFLRKVNVVNDGLKFLQTTPSPGGKNDLSLIRCASNIYRELLLGKHPTTDKHWTVEEVLEGMRERNTFRDLIFNSSEFRSGNNFRFRLSVERRGVVYGNNNTRIKPEVGRQVELADIIAATSCFPGVFEPMRFPEDFRFADRTQVADPFTENKFNFSSISLMDGGILDNQGLYGMTVSYEKSLPAFDLLIVSDTSNREDDSIYDFELKERGNGMPLSALLMIAGSILLLLLIASMWILYRSFAGLGEVLDRIAGILIGSFALLLTAVILGGSIYGLEKLKSLSVMGYKFPIWQHIKSLTIEDLFTLGKGRIDSVIAMVFTVFMNRIRSMQISKAIDARDEKGNHLYNGITVFSMIYSIVPDKHGNGAMSFHETLKPTKRMRDIAVDAPKAGTKLWLADGELDTLIACGRITMCAILLHYYWKNKRFATLPSPDQPESDYHFVYLEWQKLLAEFA